jgi:hypothetical protein
MEHDELIDFDVEGGLDFDVSDVNDLSYVNPNDSEEFEMDEYVDEFLEDIKDIDFSNISGKPFKKSFNKIKTKINAKKAVRKSKISLPLNKFFGVERKADILSRGKGLSRVLVPDDRTVIVEG